MFNRVCWSPVEIEYLQKHQAEPINQLCVALAKTRNAIKNKLLELAGKPVKTKSKKGRSKIGKRKDLGLFLRSGWEADCLRWFKAHGHIVEYEPTTFSFIPFGVSHGTVSYTPDYKVWSGKEYIWVEVKGFLKSDDKTRIRRFKKYYPEEYKKLQAITGSAKTAATKFFQQMGVPILGYFLEIKKKEADKIPGWETS